MKGVETLTITASSDIEHKQWCYALDVAVTRLRNETKTIVPPPHFPVHSGTLLYLDDSMKWKRTYVVMTEDCIFFHEHRRSGFGTPLRHLLTPNSMIFATTLNEHSFEVSSRGMHLSLLPFHGDQSYTLHQPHHQLVLFLDSIHLSALSDSERGEWIFLLEKLIDGWGFVQWIGATGR